MSQAHINARYADGLFIDIETNQPIVLREGAEVRIVTNQFYITKKESERFKETPPREVLQKGEHLWFDLKTLHGDGVLTFKLELKESLKMKKDGNQPSKVLPCKCCVVEVRCHNNNINNLNFEPLEVSSINQAYTQTSMRYRPEGGSHSRNVYEHFKLKDGSLLENLRY